MHATLTRHATDDGARWALDGRYLPADFSLGGLLGLAAAWIPQYLAALPRGEAAIAPLLAPIEAAQEVWASGVTYLSSRLAREAESQSRDVYVKVYDAPRPELFFKAAGWRVVGDGAAIRIRADSAWNVPEPELVLVIDAAGEIVGYTVGNDVSSRSIEGENPLYLPQAKVYEGSCALGPGIRLRAPEQLRDLQITLGIVRDGDCAFAGDTRSSRMKRNFKELATWLYRELRFPHGAFLLTGTGIVPDESFTLRAGDVVRIDIDGLLLQNPVA